MDELVPIREQVYKDPRPASYFDGYYSHPRDNPPDFIYDVTRMLVTPYILGVYRARSSGVRNVPTHGPVIMAPNHFSLLDSFFFGLFTRRKACFMAKSQLYKPPLQWILKHGGAFPVRRGHNDEKSFKTAHAILARGGCIGLYCEGGRSRSGKISDQARPGIGRLALESGVPVVPIAIHGANRARNWKRLQFPTVVINYGRPLRFEKMSSPDRGTQQMVADRILADIRRLYQQVEERRE